MPLRASAGWLINLTTYSTVCVDKHILLRLAFFCN